MPPRLPCYTEAELRSPDGPNLPGLWTPASIDVDDPYAFFRDTAWQPVLNLAIVTEEITADGETGLRLLAGSRPETEPTHPRVVSTPTQWITDREELELMLKIQFFDSALQDTLPSNRGKNAPVNPVIHLNEINPSRPAVVANLYPQPSVVGGINLPLGRLTQKLLAEKLGFDTWYAPENRGRLAAAKLYPSIGRVSMSRLVAGFSYVGDNENGEALYEPIVMIGAVLHTPFPKLFPRRTFRYDNLTFTPLNSFSDNVKGRKVGNLIWLDNEYEEIMMCVRGLCLSTSAEMSAGTDLIRHAATRRMGDVYDDEAVSVMASLLAQYDRQGELLAARTNAVLGQTAFAGERVAFERAALQRTNEGKPNLIRTRFPASDEEAMRMVGHLEDHLVAAGRGFTFSTRSGARPN